MTGQQLKNSILQWAIEGKLVPQIESEGTAEDLLKEIRAEKERLVKEGKLKKKDLEVKPIEEDEVPFEIPEGWRWCRLGEISNFNGGYAFKSERFTENQSDIRVIRISDFNENGLINKNPVYHPYDCKLENFIALNNDILICMTGGTVGKSCIVNFECTSMYVNQRVADIHCLNHVCYKYVYNVIRSNYFKDIVDDAKNSTNDNISAGLIKDFLIPLPPISEQRRIVEKIEELMPLVEEYGKAQERLEALNKELPERLKKSVLQEAIMGKLVPQDPKEGTAEDMLAEIRKEKEKLVKEGKLKKKDLEIKPIEDDEIPFEIPEGWRWCRLGEICSFLSRGKSPSYSDVPNQYPVFAQKCNLKEGGISLEQARFLRPDTIDKWKEEYRLKTDDVLVNSTGTGTVCRTRLYNESFQGNYPFVVPDSHVSVVRTFDSICSSYIYFLFNSKEYQDYWEDRLAGSTNQKELYIGTLYDTIVPLPPIAEQKRIVAKVEKVMKEIEGMK